MDRIATLIEEMKEFASKFKEKYLSFPYFCCEEVALSLHDLYGYFIVKGGYVGNLDNRFLNISERWGVPEVSKNPGISHTTNYDNDLEVYIDLTAFQFDKSLPEILIMDKDDPRVSAFNAGETKQGVIYCVYDMGTIEDLGNGERKFISTPFHLKPEYLRR